jgi:hypothetical protein
MTDIPASVAAVRFPKEYGDPGDGERIAWSDVEERLRSAPNYWIATVDAAGRPHARPVDGVWVDSALCFGGSPETQWVRNLEANRAVSINLSSEAEAIILEGNAELVTDPVHPLATLSTEASKAKYPQYIESGILAEFHPFWTLRPRLAYAWTLEGFPRRATRWRFETA